MSSDSRRLGTIVSMSSSSVAWRVVVPVKGGVSAKSRLHPPVGVPRRALASAIARDCLAAVVSGMPSGSVWVVSSDPCEVAFAERLGVTVVPDPQDGLNSAVAAGVLAARAAASGGGGTEQAGGRQAGTAVLLGDLPALRPADLRAALAALAGHRRGVVPDASGTGTVLLTVLGDEPLRPRFGPDSAARHAEQGHDRLELHLPRLRTDVDDDASLRAAVRLGLGPRTLACLARAATLDGMQASVHTFDDETGAGTALLDDGEEVAFSGAVFGRSALRHLRPGQRVSIELDGEREVSRLWLVGIGDGERIG